MLCQNCGKNEVNFRYTQVINGEKREIALCDIPVDSASIICEKPRCFIRDFKLS